MPVLSEKSSFIIHIRFFNKLPQFLRPPDYEAPPREMMEDLVREVNTLIDTAQTLCDEIEIKQPSYPVESTRQIITAIKNGLRNVPAEKLDTGDNAGKHLYMPDDISN